MEAKAINVTTQRRVNDVAIGTDHEESILLPHAVQPTDGAGPVTKDERVRLHVHQMAGFVRLATIIGPMDVDASNIDVVHAVIVGHHRRERLTSLTMRRLVAMGNGEHREVAENVSQRVRSVLAVQENKVGQYA